MNDKRNGQPFDWLAFLLLMLMSLIAAWALTATEWAEDLNLVPLIVLVGVWAGSALARSRFPGWLAAIFAIAYGLFIVGWQLGSTLDPALIWQRKLLVLYGRTAVFGSVLIVGEPNRDPLMFVLLMCLVFWLIGVLSAWGALRRDNLWIAVLPGALAIIVVASYYLGEVALSFFLGAYLFLALILAVRMELNRHQSHWSSYRARVPMDINLRISLSGLVASATLVILAWGAPAFARSEQLADTWSVISRPFATLKERAGDALGTVRGPSAVVASEYDDVLQLGAGTQPENRLVMIVAPASFPRFGGRFYWRARVYDRYEEYQWFSPPTESISFNPAEEALPIDTFRGREVVEISVSPVGAALRQLYLPALPVWVDRTSDVLVSNAGEGAGEVIQIFADKLVYEGESYIARSALASPSAEQLRRAGEVYPDSIYNQYLQLPETVSQRVVDLAHEITAGIETPYDKAVAITRWLRANITYDRVTEAPPTDADPLDWFLFDYRIGFCNYYASAEVVMLRVLGIPARIAAGYARGTYDAEQGLYLVYAEDSHAWPEVYFPEYGWVEFEPTLSQPVLTRPEGLGSNDPGGGFQANPDGSEAPSAGDRLEGLLDPEAAVPGAGGGLGPSRLTNRILLMAAIGVLLALGWIRINPSSWINVQAGLAKVLLRTGFEAPRAFLPNARGWATPTGRMYAAWSAWLKRLELATSEAETPRERVARFQRALPARGEQANVLVEAYMMERFAQEEVDEAGVREAWRSLRTSLWTAWLWKLTARWREGPPVASS
jgi:transglutaminase-like putative cysteine protease